MAAEASLVIGDLDISKLSDDELYQQLSALGETVGPVMGTTRKIYERKLACKLGVSGGSSFMNTSAESDEDVQEDDVEPSQAYIDRLASGSVRQRRPIIAHDTEDSEEDESDYLSPDTRNAVFTPSPRRPLKSANTSQTSQRLMEESFLSSHNKSIPPVFEEQQQQQQLTESASSTDYLSLIFKVIVVSVFIGLFYIVFVHGHSGDEFSRLENLAKSASNAMNSDKKPGAQSQ